MSPVSRCATGGAENRRTGTNEGVTRKTNKSVSLWWAAKAASEEVRKGLREKDNKNFVCVADSLGTLTKPQSPMRDEGKKKKAENKEAIEKKPKSLS